MEKAKFQYGIAVFGLHIDPSRKTGVQGELIGGENGMNFIGYAWQNC